MVNNLECFKDNNLEISNFEDEEDELLEKYIKIDSNESESIFLVLKYSGIDFYFIWWGKLYKLITTTSGVNNVCLVLEIYQGGWISLGPRIYEHINLIN